jgi:tRNA-uridine 2-sulfurtransferase
LSVNRRSLVLMSGGVDSSVAAFLMKEQGYTVTGIIMKIYEGEPGKGSSPRHGCYGPEEESDIEDARRVAEQLDIPLQVMDLTEEYKSEVLDYFCEEYLTGRTPNPCVRCNQRVKFGALIQKATEAGIDFDLVASGHYARIEFETESKRYLLKKALDLSKDQSYFLTFLTQEQLGRLVFPLGNLTKREVREMAERLGLKTATKPDSQNFISGDYSSVIKAEDKPGPIIDQQGRLLGQHKGLQYYTIGQRKGLGLAVSGVTYVTSIDPERNAIVVGQKIDNLRSECRVAHLNWISINRLEAPLAVKVKIRSSQKEAQATLIPKEEGVVEVHFEEPQMAVTPGQAAVFYQQDVVVGGGIIQGK